jgi:hypothetical protein
MKTTQILLTEVNIDRLAIISKVVNKLNGERNLLIDSIKAGAKQINTTRAHVEMRSQKSGNGKWIFTNPEDQLEYNRLEAQLKEFAQAHGAKPEILVADLVIEKDHKQEIADKVDAVCDSATL